MPPIRLGLNGDFSGMGQLAGVQDALNEYYMTGATHDLYSFGGAGHCKSLRQSSGSSLCGSQWSISGGILSLTNDQSQVSDLRQRTPVAAQQLRTDGQYSSDLPDRGYKSTDETISPNRSAGVLLCPRRLPSCTTAKRDAPSSWKLRLQPETQRTSQQTIVRSPDAAARREV